MSEVGEAFEYMGMAGWSTSEMLDGVQSTLNLAKIGATDLGTASKKIWTAIKKFIVKNIR